MSTEHTRVCPSCWNWGWQNRNGSPAPDGPYRDEEQTVAFMCELTNDGCPGRVRDFNRERLTWQAEYAEFVREQEAQDAGDLADAAEAKRESREGR